MGYYGGKVAAGSDTPGAAALLAWHPWAQLRIVSFIVLGVLLAQPLLGRIWNFRVNWLDYRRSSSRPASGCCSTSY
jgi:hypothetical protein